MGPEVFVREGPEKLTLRAEEVGYPEVVYQCRSHRTGEMGPPLVDADWHVFCQAIYKGIEGEDWEELYDCFKEMSKAAGFKKPHETPKTKAPWKMQAVKDIGEDFPGPDRKDNILGRK